MAREKYQTRLPADTAEQVNDYIEDREISQSEAIRRLVETGLEVERDDGEIIDTRDMATVNMNERARQSGTILMLLLLGFLTAAEVGLV